MLNRSKTSLRIAGLGLAFSIVVLLAADAAIGEDDLACVAHETTSHSRPGAAVCCSLVRFYQTIISPIGASSCRMYPSCSAFAYEAFEKHGFFLGMMLTSDRLMRDTFLAGTDYPLIQKDGEWLLYDPLMENTWRHGVRRVACVGRKQ